jgi:dihydrodipicolinate synthase/N-acetylneuraminate lyase
MKMLSGIIPLVVTPFDENDGIDENGLRADEVDRLKDALQNVVG